LTNEDLRSWRKNMPTEEAQREANGTLKTEI
jgi:hypothetical protein